MLYRNHMGLPTVLKEMPKNPKGCAYDLPNGNTFLAQWPNSWLYTSQQNCNILYRPHTLSLPKTFVLSHHNRLLAAFVLAGMCEASSQRYNGKLNNPLLTDCKRTPLCWLLKAGAAAPGYCMYRCNTAPRPCTHMAHNLSRSSASSLSSSLFLLHVPRHTFQYCLRRCEGHVLVAGKSSPERPRQQAMQLDHRKCKRAGCKQ